MATTYRLRRKTFATTAIAGQTIAKLANQEAANLAKVGGKMTNTTTKVANGVTAQGNVMKGSAARNAYEDFWKTADLGKTNTTTTNTILGTATNNETGAVRNITTGTDSNKLDKYKVGVKPPKPQPTGTTTTVGNNTGYGTSSSSRSTNSTKNGWSTSKKVAVGLGGAALVGTGYAAKKIDNAANGIG